jgi:hypothetical protein
MEIDRMAGDPRPVLGGARNVFLRHSLASAGGEIDRLLELGAGRLFLQLQADEDLPPDAAIERHCAVVRGLRDRYGSALRLAADTAGLCMHHDLRWGVLRPDGALDPEATLEVLATAAGELAQAGIDALVTVGRVNFEARVARAALDAARPGIALWAFSTNSETASAYFSVTANALRRAHTGQKLLVGNAREMLLRALRDIAEGVDVVIQKPVESLHLLGLLRALLDGELDLDRVRADPVTAALEEAAGGVFAGGWPDTSRLASVALGAYEVSGTYQTHRLIEDTYSEDLAVTMADELFVNTLAAGGRHLQVLIARSVLWYLERRDRAATLR